MSSPHVKEMVKLLNRQAYRYHTWELFRDFCEMAAIALAVCDLGQRDAREEQYLRLIGKYDRETQQMFPELLGLLALEIDGQPKDVLGRVFHELELASKWTGQFFTPNEICQLMARLTIGDGEEICKDIDRRGYITVHEPATGGGAMLLAFADAFIQAGFSSQHQLHATAVDVDPVCVHMSFVQLSLCHIPAVVIHGNSLTQEEHARWYTPAHILHGWGWRLRVKELCALDPAAATDVIPAPVILPSPALHPDRRTPTRQLALF